MVVWKGSIVFKLLEETCRLQRRPNGHFLRKLSTRPIRENFSFEWVAVCIWPSPPIKVVPTFYSFDEIKTNERSEMTVFKLRILNLN